MAPQGLPVAAYLTILWLLAVHKFRSLFSGLLRQRAVA
jgi:hypothetical protein